MAYPTNSMLENTPLGMYFQGQSIGDEQRLNREKSEAHGLKYLMDQMTAGNDLAKSDLEGARARIMNTPDQLDWYGRGYRGQMMSQDAAGQYAQDTLANKILQGNQEYKEKYAKGLISEEEHKYQLDRIKKALAGQGPAQQPSTGQIGFDMQPPPVDPSTVNYGNEGRSVPILKTEAAMKNSMGNDYRTGSKPYDIEIIDKEIASNPQARDILMQERARIVKELEAGGGGTGTPNMGVTPGSSSLMNNFSQGGAAAPGANPWLQGMDMQDPRHQNVMGAFMDTPEFRRKMAEQTQRQQEAQLLQERRLSAQRAIAGLRQKAAAGDKTAEQALVSYLDREVAAGRMTEEERANELAGIFNAKNAAKTQQGTTLDTTKIPDAPIKPKDPQKTYTPGTTNAGRGTQAPQAAASEVEAGVKAAGFNYEPNLYDYRKGPNGKWQRKKKE